MGRDLNEVLDEIGIGRYHVVQLLLVGGVMISDGAEILLASSILNALKDVWHLSGLVRGYMMSIIFVGVAAGGLIGGALGDTIGRRKTILISYIGIVIFGACTAAAAGPISMLCLRFCFGVSFGTGMGTGVSLQVETAPSTWRGHVVNLGGLWFTVGEVYTATLLMIFMPDLTDPTDMLWRYVTLFTVVPGLILLPFTFLLLGESPHFLLSRGRYEEAVAATQQIALTNRQSEIAESLVGDDPSKKLARTLPNADEHPPLVERRRSFGSSSSSRPSSSSARDVAAAAAAGTALVAGASSAARPATGIREIMFGVEYRSIVLGGAYLCFLANFMFYGLTYSLPQIFATLKHEMEPAFEVLIISLCDAPGTILACLMIYSKRIGHRTGLTILCCLSSVVQVALISIDHGGNWIYLGVPAAYLAKWTASAYFLICYVYLGEVFPSSCRVSALSLCISCGRLGSIIAPILYEECKHKDSALGEHSFFLLLTAALSLVGVVVIKFCLYFELKNQALQDFAPVEGKSDEEDLSSAPARAG